MHICASGAGATPHEGQARKHVSIPSKRMPRRRSGSKPPAERSATSTRISLHHHGSLIIHCRSTWTPTTPRALSARHLLRTSAHTLHPCTDAACLSWLLQGCSIRSRRAPASTIASVSIAHTARDSSLHGPSRVSSRCGMPCILHAPSPGYFSAHSSADDASQWQ